MIAAAIPIRADPVRPARIRFRQIPGSPALEYYVFVPDDLAKGAEPLVLVHGISRNAAELVLRFSGLARLFGVPLIAPLFRREVHGQYQQALDHKTGQRSDLALCAILADARQHFALATDKVSLFGFSGGAQFAHRFALIHPRRVRACVPASAGWYTMPDPGLAWPIGLAGMPGSGNASEAQDVPFHLIVGQRDRQEDDALRRDPELDRLQGPDRLARAKAWYAALHRAGWNAAGSLTVLPRTRHSFNCAHRNGLGPTVFRLLGYEGIDT